MSKKSKGKTIKPAKKKLNQNKARQNQQTQKKSVLRFSPTAWGKLIFFRDHGDTEIGGFGITQEDDLLFIHDFITVKQKASIVSIAFEDEAVADFFDDQVDAGRKPEQFSRIWLHTHPGESPQPSEVDEETFRRAFGACEWAVMFVLGQGGKTYVRLRFNVGPGGDLELPVKVDYRAPFASSNNKVWETEYKSNIIEDCSCLDFKRGQESESRDMSAFHSLPDCWKKDLELMKPEERGLIMDELFSELELWEDII